MAELLEAVVFYFYIAGVAVSEMVARVIVIGKDEGSIPDVANGIKMGIEMVMASMNVSIWGNEKFGCGALARDRIFERTGGWVGVFAV